MEDHSYEQVEDVETMFRLFRCFFVRISLIRKFWLRKEVTHPEIETEDQGPALFLHSDEVHCCSHTKHVDLARARSTHKNM